MAQDLNPNTDGASPAVQVQLGGADLERLVLVGGDLEYLIDISGIGRLPTHTEVRLCASVLRRLLVDNELGQLWRRIGLKSTPLVVEVTEIDSALAAWPHKWIRYAWAGGGVSVGAQHAGLVLAIIPRAEWMPLGSAENFFKANPLPAQGRILNLTLSDWLRSTSVAIQTNEIGLVKVSRQSVIKYIANRKGGVHFDPSRDLTIAKIKRRQLEIESHLLDHGLLRVGHLSGPEFEIASMVQAIGTSAWAAEIVRLAHEAAPSDFQGDPNELKFWTGDKEADGTGWATSRFEPSGA